MVENEHIFSFSIYRHSCFIMHFLLHQKMNQNNVKITTLTLAASQKKKNHFAENRNTPDAVIRKFHAVARIFSF